MSKTKKKNIKPLPKRTYIGCVETKNRSPWCFRLCTPNTEGLGRCGRIAPHFLKSRIQRGINEYLKKRGEGSEEFDKKS